MSLESKGAERMTNPSLIETLRLDADGDVPLLPGHLTRVATSAEALRYRWPGEDVWIMQVAQALQGLPKVAHRVRVLTAPDGAIAVETAPLLPLGERPLVSLAPAVLDSQEPYLQHKTTRRDWYEPASAWLAQHPAYFDLLFFNERGELCEGSRSNVYVLLEQGWVTPPVSSGLLPGVQRAALLESGAVQEAVLTATDLQRAQSVRLSNALRGWFEVTVAEAPGLA